MMEKIPQTRLITSNSLCIVLYNCKIDDLHSKMAEDPDFEEELFDDRKKNLTEWADATERERFFHRN